MMARIPNADWPDTPPPTKRLRTFNLGPVPVAQSMRAYHVREVLADRHVPDVLATIVLDYVGPHIFSLNDILGDIVRLRDNVPIWAQDIHDCCVDWALKDIERGVTTNTRYISMQELQDIVQARGNIPSHCVNEFLLKDLAAALHKCVNTLVQNSATFCQSFTYSGQPSIRWMWALTHVR